MDRRERDHIESVIRSAKNGVPRPTSLERAMRDPATAEAWSTAMLALSDYAMVLEAKGASRYEIGLHISAMPMRLVLDALEVPQ